MATSTLIQRLDSTALVASSTVPGGYDVVTTPDVSNRRQVETFIAGATVVVGDWLQFDTSATGANRVLTVIQAGANGTGNPLVVGVCLGSAETDGTLTVGSKINVIVAGYSEKTNCAFGGGSPVNAAGIALTVGAAGAGQAVAIGAGQIGPACGVSLATASVANVAPVWVYKQF
jgi:hypothetical protein